MPCRLCCCLEQRQQQHALIRKHIHAALCWHSWNAWGDCLWGHLLQKRPDKQGRSCRIVLAQLEGSGRGSLGSYNADSYEALTTMLHEEPMKDGDAWVEKLLQRNEMLGALLFHTILGS